MTAKKCQTLKNFIYIFSFLQQLKYFIDGIFLYIQQRQWVFFANNFIDLFEYYFFCCSNCYFLYLEKHTQDIHISRERRTFSCTFPHRDDDGLGVILCLSLACASVFGQQLSHTLMFLVSFLIRRLAISGRLSGTHVMSLATSFKIEDGMAKCKYHPLCLTSITIYLN